MSSVGAMALAWLVAQSAAVTLDASDLARVQARPLTIDGDDAALDVENTPQLELGLSWPTTTLSLAYAPRLQWVNVLGSTGSPLVVMHQATASVGLRKPRYSVWLTQSLAIGEQNFGRLGTGSSLGGAPSPSPTTPSTTPDGTPDTPGGVPDAPSETPAGASVDASTSAPDPLPTLTVVDVAESQTSAGLRYAWSPRWSSSHAATYAIAGGASRAARRLLVQQRAVALDTTLDYRHTRTDTIASSLELSRITTSSEYRYWLATWLETWTHAWAPAEEGGASLGAGAWVQDTRDPQDTLSSGAGPALSARVWDTVQLGAGSRLRLQADVAYLPNVNVLVGTLQRRLTESARATWMLERTSFSGALSAAQTLPRGGAGSADVVSAELGVDRVLIEGLSLQVGGQLQWQQTFGAGVVALAGTRWLVFAALLGRLPTVRL